MSVKSEERKIKTTSFIFLSAVGVLWIAPLIWILSTSLKPESAAISWPIRWIPETPTLKNYIDVISNTSEAPILKWFVNSLFIAVSHTVLVLFIASLAAYAYSRLEFKGRDKIFWSLMATMMIPPIMNLIPAYSIVNFLGWIDTPWAMIIPGLGGVFGIFLLRQFFLGIPKELEEAAIIDGATLFQIYWKIILPLSKPALVVLALFTFMGNWNDFLWPLIVTNSIEMRTLPVGLSILQGTYNIQYAKMMAATFISAVPVLILFLLAQRFFVKGISLSGVKG
ncbi:carbohydrate ABC transporter permease [Lederbergia citrea]|uniref:carbohydrate ABC transporter permease n=1 Tax=Lederbergia citrea TaxID=2833581 RepID=UPI001BC97EB1|nr:carbohydrate ABC transporter permease [Lederbergia citrea]MBS4179519.1 carbohydrate ABC transporter permease [Lederbergia citrea]MBS4206187.1 carbohydrate ABC transporter permease [Lederbergia citrea]